jgi:N-acetylneuraminic acid mutarotase
MGARLHLNPLRVVAGTAAIVAVLLLVKLVTGIGPDLPGPRVRELIGLAKAFAPCKPDPHNVRRPNQPVTSTIPWRRGNPTVPALGYEEVRAVAAGGQIYLGSGIQANSDGSRFASLDPFFRFDPVKGTYSRLSHLPQPLDHAVFASWHGQVYVFGGFSNGKPSAHVWRYSPRTGHWTARAPMRHPRAGFAGAVIGDRLYAAGGLTKLVAHPGLFRGLFGGLEIYDFRTNRWRDGPPMPTPRHHVAAAAVGGKLYVAGGRGTEDLSLRAFERFDPASNTWERLPGIPLGTGDPAVVGARGHVIVISGGDDAKNWITPATWSFDPRTSSWRRLSDLIVPRHGFGAAIEHGRIYVFGGAPCAGYGGTRATESLDLRAVS